MLAALCLLSIAVAVWGGIFVWRGSLLVACFSFIFVGYIVSRDLVRFDIGGLPMTMDRPVLAMLMGLFFLKWIGGELKWARWGWCEWSLLAFCILMAVSTFAHDWVGKRYSTTRYAPIYRLVACYLMPFVLFHLVRNSKFTPRSVYGVFGLLSLFGLYLAITANLEFAKLWELVFPKTIADSKLGIHFGRSRGPALQSQSLGFYLGVCGTCAWLWLGTLSRFGLMLRLALLPVFVAAMFFTSTRCVWMGAVLVTFVYVVVELREPWRPLVLVGSILMAVGIIAVGRGNITQVSRGDQSQAASAESVQSRKVYAYVSWLMFLDRPLLGCGAGQFVPESKPYKNDHSVNLNLRLIREVPHHNTYLSVLVELGLVGLGLMLATHFGWLRTAWRLWHSNGPLHLRMPGLAMLCSYAMYLPDALFFDPGSYAHQDHYLLFFMAGLSSGAFATLQAKSPATSLITSTESNRPTNNVTLQPQPA